MSNSALFHTLNNQLSYRPNYIDLQSTLELIRITQFGEGLDGYKVPQYTEKQKGPLHNHMSEVVHLMLLSVYKQIINAPEKIINIDISFMLLGRKINCAPTHFFGCNLSKITYIFHSYY